VHALLKFECFAFLLEYLFLRISRVLDWFVGNMVSALFQNIDLVDLRRGKLFEFRSSSAP